MSQPAATTIDVAALIDRRAVGWFQIRALLLCLGVALADGYDAQVMGYVIPSLARAWGLNRSAFGAIFSVGFVGLLLGSLIFGLAADRFGRRRIVILCTLIFSILTLATVLAQSVPALLVLRFLTGLGVGGAIPNIIALMVEYSPRRRRSTMTTLIQCGISIGSAMVGFLVAPLLARLGWQTAFYVGSLFPLALVPLLQLYLPESIRFLVVQRRPRAQIAAILGRIDPGFRLGDRFDFLAEEHRRTGSPLTHLFTEGRAPLTALLWLSFILNVFVIFSLVPWMPTLVASMGIVPAQAARISAMYAIGGLCGAIGFGWLIDRFGVYRVLALSFCVAALMVVCIGLGGPSILLVTIAVFGAGICGSGAQYGANSHAGNFYPTFMRSTGTGWALGAGRVGGALGPLMLGALVTRHWPVIDIVCVYGLITFGAALAIAAMGVLARWSAPV